MSCDLLLSCLLTVTFVIEIIALYDEVKSVAYSMVGGNLPHCHWQIFYEVF